MKSRRFSWMLSKEIRKLSSSSRKEEQDQLKVTCLSKWFKCQQVNKTFGFKGYLTLVLTIRDFYPGYLWWQCLTFVYKA
ncbi:hypothetical protein NIES4101_86830 [Calothrix sp. NIES-4101]|nr:hypothetical protein NIES4101_86830 [Calothrix sp. NIES-4101]